jgi:hypothetical protein
MFMAPTNPAYPLAALLSSVQSEQFLLAAVPSSFVPAYTAASVSRSSVAFISQATIARRILDHLGFDSKGPTIARAHPELFDPGTDYSVDPVYPDPRPFSWPRRSGRGLSRALFFSQKSPLQGSSLTRFAPPFLFSLPVSA